MRMMDSEQTCTRSDPVFMEKSRPSDCFWNETTGFIGAHWANAGGSRQSERRTVPNSQRRQKRLFMAKTFWNKPTAELLGRQSFESMQPVVLSSKETFL
jgi:hypothetical protein